MDHSKQQQQQQQRRTRLSRQSSDGISQPPVKTVHQAAATTRTTTAPAVPGAVATATNNYTNSAGLFSNDLESKQRATIRHNTRQQRQRKSRQKQKHDNKETPNTNISSPNDDDDDDDDDDDEYYNNTDDHWLTAIPVNDNEDGHDDELDEMEKMRIAEKAKNDVRLKIFSAAVEAEVTDFATEEKDRKKKQRRRLLTRGLLLLLLLLVGGGVAIGVALSRSSSSNDENLSESETSKPTASPTIQPPIFIPPTPPPAGTGVGGGGGGGGSNEDGGFLAPPLLDNTVCEGAFDIATTIGEAFFGNISELATVAPVDTCEVIFRNGVGVWYRIQGDGSRYRASTCEGTTFDTQISIFSGACGKLRCVAGNDQMNSCGNGDQSLVGFATEPNTDYYIYVQARRKSQSLFKMLVDNLNTNDECEGAVPLEYEGPSRFDSTRGSTIDNVECLGNIPDAPGVWYSVQGIELDAGFDLFQENRFRVTYDTSDTAFSPSIRTMVFEGSDCGSLTCVSNGVVWDVKDGVTYYILVYGSNAASEGDYRISVGPDSNLDFPHLIQPNGCDDPVFLVPGAMERGTTGSRPRFGSCGNLVFATSGGVWYQVTGTGNPLTVSTCNSATGLDTQISVLRGPCDELVCVDGNDQACGDQSSVSWFSEAGVVYYIVVHGYATHSGAFSVYLEETDIIGNNTCESGLSLDANGVSILGSTENAASATLPVCTGIPQNKSGVWYRVLGSGRSMTASTCQSTNDVSSSISVLRGECTSLECVEVVESPCGNHRSITWESVRNVEYFIFVHTLDTVGTSGSFTFYVEDTSSNDICENAVGPLGIDGSSTFGSTRSSTSDVVVSVDSRGVWFSVLGTGTTLSASTCSEYTSFPASLSVYKGNDCNALTSVQTTTALGCTENGAIESWSSVEDEVYYLLVSGVSVDDFGNFALSITAQ